MLKIASAVMVLAMAAAGCAPRGAAPPAPPPAAPVVDLRDASGEPAPLSTFVNAARPAKYILIGEQHSSACDHLAQAALLRALAWAGLKPALGLEMVGADKQPVLDRFNQGAYTVPQLEEELNWPMAWGYDFSLYAPLFRVAREYAIPIYGLNLPAGMVREFSEKGEEGLSDEQRVYMPRELIPQTPEQEEDLKAMFEMHDTMRKAGDDSDAETDDGMDPDTPDAETPAETQPTTPEEEAAKREAMDRFFRVQSLWDTTMAERAVAAGAGRSGPVVIAAGGGHVEHGWGIAHRLRVLDPAAPEPLVVMGWRGPVAGEPTPDPERGDLFFYCPAMHRSGRLGMTLLLEENGVRVTEVAPESRAEEAGLQEGDLIVRVGESPAESLSVLHLEAMKASKAGDGLELTVQRDGDERTLAIPVGSGADDD